MNYLKQSTAATIVLGPFIDDTDGKTAETGLTIAQADVRLSKAGGAFAQKGDASSATHMEFGYYSVPLSTADTGTLGPLKVCVSEAGALPVFADYTVLAANVYDSLIGGGDLLSVDVSQFGNANGTFASGRPEVNTTHAAGTAWNSGAIGATTLAADTLTAAKVASDVGTEIGTAVWATAARTLTAGTNIVLAKGTGVTGFNDLDAAGVRGAVGLASANLDTQIGTLATASALATVDTVVDAILVDTDSTIPGTLATLATAANLATVAGYVDTEIGTLLTNLATVDTVVDAIKAKTDNLPAAPAAVSDIPTAGAVADAVWDEALSGHLGAGSTGNALNAAGSAGDPWSTALPGAYGAGSAGYIIGTNLDAQVSTAGGGLDAAGVRTALGMASANLDTQLGAISTKVDAVDDLVDTEVAAIKTVVDAIEVDTQDIQSRIPAALVSGRMDASVGAMAADTVTASALAADAVTEIQSGLATAAALTTVDTVVDAIQAKTDNLPADPADASTVAGLIAAVEAKVDTVDTVADAIKAKTDGLTFTVANVLDANIQRINDVVVNGDGAGTPWGP